MPNSCSCILNKLYYHKHAISEKEYKKLKRKITVANEMRWIPCSERLPEENGWYLITGKRGTVYSIGYEDKRWYGGTQPIAWMPLPEAYREEAQDE